MRGLARARLQGIQAVRSVIRFVLRCECICIQRRGDRRGDLRIRAGFREVPVALQPRDGRGCLGVQGSGFCRMLRRPELARGDRGLVLTLDGPFQRVEIGLELAPPPGHGRRFLR